mgnify:CR=1 FL=1
MKDLTTSDADALIAELGARARDAALALAPALPPAGEQRTRLRDMLIQGHCPTEALAQVQDPINRQTLLALVSRLGGCRGS